MLGVSASSNSTPTAANQVLLPEPLALGRPVVHYNRWTGWNADDSEKTREHFRHMTSEELRALKPGDLVWMDTDPIHHNGKVYGWIPSRITRTEIDDASKKIKIHYQSDFSLGYTIESLEAEFSQRVDTVPDLDALAKYAKEHPLCLTAGSHI